MRVGFEQDQPSDLVCYCFDHSVESIRDEIRRSGRSTVVDSVTRRIKAGECRCELLNPKGTCCLGDVRAVVREALDRVESRRDPAADGGGAEHSCCGGGA